VKYLIAGLWILVAFVFRDSPGVRRFLAYSGSVLAFVHICALVFGKIDTHYNRRPVEGGVPLGGFIVGIAVGIILGVVAGGAVSRNPVLYWAVQVVAAAFLMFLPLFRL